MTTELNEVGSVDSFIESLMNQSVKPDEIVIADAGSIDGTVDKIKHYIRSGAPINLIVVKGNRSVGRNTAIKASKNNIIAVTDFGSELDKDWLKNITKPFERAGVEVVAGFYKVTTENFFEEVSSDYIFYNNDKINLDTWLPSSRSIAFTKRAWSKSGGYPEFGEFGDSKITRMCGGEDTIFDLNLKKAGYYFADGLDAIVDWRPRSNIVDFFKQYRMYSLGDGITLNNKTYFVKTTLKYMIILAFCILAVWWVWSLLIAFTLGGAYIFRKVLAPWKKTANLRKFPLMCLVALVFDLAQIAGFWRGYLERLKVPKKLRVKYF